jgi:formate hydrogenlyase subunit 3/multisubunit Na+/H+ antiporter MnhD subunit
MLGLITSLLLAGTITTFIGYYTPTMLLGTILMSISSGLITTWSPQTSLPTIIGYNLLSGLGIGFAFQQPFIAVQTVLKQEHVPAGIVILQFAQYLGNIVALAGAQNLFIGKLMGGLRREVPEIDASLVLKTGALDLGKIIPEKYAVRVLKVYADALDWSFVVATVLACVTVFGALGMKWESIKKDEENGVAGGGEVRIE